MDYGVRRGLGFIAIGVGAFLVGLLARGMEGGVQGVFQVVGFIGFTLVVVGLVIAGKTLLRGEGD
jgi:hypothetical protein